MQIILNKSQAQNFKPQNQRGLPQNLMLKLKLVYHLPRTLNLEFGAWDFFFKKSACVT